ncbi:MAG: gas vesicle protein GvpG [Methanothrix sp.]|nr:gas vesicle protein GvpG [Methanothrix sp.]
MFIVDDLLLRTLGLSLPGFDMIWMLEQVQKFAYKELYNPETIKNQIKETRLLYEFGEMAREEYERKNSELMDKLRLALKAEEMNLSSRTEILG